MSNRNDGPGNKQVVDDEGTVDEKLKNEIIRARSRVSTREDNIFVKGPLEGVPYDHDQLAQIWATPVRQYVRRVEPLLQSDEIRGAREFYLDKVVAKRKVYPPDGKTEVYGDGGQDTVEIEWSRFYRDGIDLHEVKMRESRFGQQFSPPEPKEYKLVGLKDVIERPEQSFEWSVQLGNSWNPNEHMTAAPSRNVTMDKRELERAVRYTDIFLQDHAGIAINVGHQEKDERELNPV